jgi:guanylate kinase
LKKNKVFVISGPSGVGKGTLVESILKRVPNITRSVSATTREPRAGEKNNDHYHFVAQRQFEDKVESGEFLEWAEVHGNLYGTMRETVSRELAQGNDVILVIDVQGGLAVKDNIPDSILIFVEPPSIRELRARLEKRGTELPEAVDARIEVAQKELEKKSDYDYSIVNEDLDTAVAKLISIIEDERKGI